MNKLGVNLLPQWNTLENLSQKVIPIVTLSSSFLLILINLHANQIFSAIFFLAIITVFVDLYFNLCIGTSAQLPLSVWMCIFILGYSDNLQNCGRSTMPSAGIR